MIIDGDMVAVPLNRLAICFARLPLSGLTVNRHGDDVSDDVSHRCTIVSLARELAKRFGSWIYISYGGFDSPINQLSSSVSSCTRSLPD